MNIERESLPNELIETQKIRNGYLPLRAANLWGKLVEESTNTTVKKIDGFIGMLEVVGLSMIVDGNAAIKTAFVLAVLGGMTAGEKIPLFSGPVGFLKEKKAIRVVREKKNVSPEEIANLLYEFPDMVAREEVELWPKKKMGEESLEHPERYLIMKAVLKNNPETPDVVVEKFMEAQKLALGNRRLNKNMRKEALEKAADIGIGVGIMVGITYGVSFGLGCQAQAGIVGLADDVVLYGILGYSFTKEKVKSLLSKYR